MRLLFIRGTHRHQRAFTLIEVVVALALVSLLAVALFESLRFGQRSFDKVIRQGGNAWEVHASQRLLRSLLESAYPQEADLSGSTPYGLDGAADKLVLTAAAPLAANGAGLYRYEISLRRRADGASDVVIRWVPDYDAQSLVGAAGVDEEVLLEAVRTLEWSYLDETDAPGVATEPWRREWQRRRALPRLIRLRVTFPAHDSRRWPDLIVAPRITDDANCVFDVVAQRCRVTV